MKNFDPFAIFCVLLIFCCLFFFGCIFISEREDKNNKALIIKDAIKKGWTPDQVKALIQDIKK
jgi:hypothetical protein